MILSATDAKERQHWVSRLQICTQHHTEAMGKVRKCRVCFPKKQTHIMWLRNILANSQVKTMFIAEFVQIFLSICTRPACTICMCWCVVVASFLNFAFILKTNPPLKTRSLSAASQGSSSSPASQRKISHNAGTLLGLSQFHRGSSNYSSKRSVLRDHLVEAREVRP